MSVALALSSQTTDVPLTTVAITASKLTDDLVSVANVKSAADLKGKAVAVSAFGGLSHGVVLLQLKQMGLAPEDVVVTQIGGQSARIG